MKIKELLTVLLFLCFVNINVTAQEKQRQAFFKGKNERDKIENVDSIKYVADSLRRELLHRDSIASVNIKLIDSIRSSAKQDSMRMIVRANRQKDSLMLVIRNKEKEIAKLQGNMGFVDTCMVKLANRWLYERYDRAAVKEAISYFDRIYSANFKQEYSIVQELLKQYESSYRDFQTILKKAQADFDRENPFACDDFRSRYIRMIENMYYYTKYYNSDWNIRYLNEQIAEALERLKNHSDGKFADFSTLIDPNF